MENSNETQVCKTPICTVEDLSEAVTACATFAIRKAANNSMSSNYYIGYDDLSHLITKEDYEKYFPLIQAEVSGREEVLDLEEGDEPYELNMNLGTDWCKSYEPLSDEELHVYGFREVSDELSLAEKARRYDQTLTIANAKLADPDQPKEYMSASFPDFALLTNTFGQPLYGGSLPDWAQTAVTKFNSPDQWCPAPTEFVALIGIFNRQPCAIYNHMFSEDSYGGDLDFMNAVCSMTSGFLQDRLVHKGLFQFASALPATHAAETADLCLILPAAINETDLKQSLTALDEAFKDPGNPKNNLEHSGKLYDLSITFCAKLVQANSPYTDIPKQWLERSVPEMASWLCEQLYAYPDTYNLNDLDALFQRLPVSPAIQALFNEACHKLRQPVTLTTYAREGDPTYNLESEETPTITFELPYGALREILRADVQEGERPLSVEDFLDTYTWDYSESIRDSWEVMGTHPSLADRLAHAEGKMGPRSSESRSVRENEKEV